MFKRIPKLGGPILLALILAVTACSPQNNNNPTTQSPTQAATSAQAAPTHTSHLIELSPFPSSTPEANATIQATAGTPDANAPTGQPNSQPTSAANSVPTIQANTPAAAASGTQTVAATATVSPSGSGSSSGPADKYKYVSQNYPDKTQVRPGVELTMTWAVENTGTTAWTTDYELRYFTGPANSAPNVVKFPKTVPPNTVANLTVEIVAPTNPGDYDSWWKLTNAQGQNFGDVDLMFTVTNTPKSGTSATPAS
ncbi:MAG: NBR1-Ig-like domain-containing protein [Anaerolineaceae bacterium]|nr:NBR1-Ig-like domain-containing protein [Anaerolineaceae bacterium]